MTADQYNQEWVGRVAVVTMTGELDMLTAPQLQQRLRAALDQNPVALVVDLSGLDFLASVGIQLLVETHNAITPQVRFAVVADGPATSRPMKLTGVTELIAVYPNRDLALSNVEAFIDPEAGTQPSL
jgi:anti-anti-sigma factor